MDRERVWEMYEVIIEQIGAETLADNLARYFNADEVGGALGYIASNYDISLEKKEV